MDWAARHPGRVRGIAVTETFLRPMRWAELTELEQARLRLPPLRHPPTR